jgi:hypothetical protein
MYLCHSGSVAIRFSKAMYSRHAGSVAIRFSKAMYSRHAGSVAAHRLRQRSRRPDRHVVCPIAVFSDSISADRQTNQVRPNRRGRFFRAKAQKKIAPDGSAKACLLTAGMPTHQDGLASTSLKSKKRPAKSTQSNCIWSACKPDGSSF